MRNFNCAVCKVPVDPDRCVRRVDMDGMTLFFCKPCAARKELVQEKLRGRDWHRRD